MVGEELLKSLVARRREPLLVVMDVGFLEVEEGLAFGDFGGQELLFGGEGVVDANVLAGSADVCPALGVGDLAAFGLGRVLLFAGHLERSRGGGIRSMLAAKLLCCYTRRMVLRCCGRTRGSIY